MLFGVNPQDQSDHKQKEILYTIPRQKSAVPEVYEYTVYKTKAKKILLINKDESSEDISRDRAD